jgi:hypothetical protein
MTESASRFGFVAFAETWNGRLAMLGFVIGHPFPNWSGLSAMETDYTAAISVVALITAVLSAMTIYVLSRPTDLAKRV